MREIDRHEVQRLLEAGAQLVNVLPAEEFEEERIAGSIGIPLRRIDAEARDRLDPAKPVVTYCWDSA